MSIPNEEDSIERCEREIKHIEEGREGEAALWLYLLGWADWHWQKWYLEEKAGLPHPPIKS